MSSAIWLALCSTPFGISDEGTPPPSPITSSPKCAQRLSASRMKGHETDSQLDTNREECSTPFGISDEGTRAHSGSCPIMPSAQRLSASRMKGPGPLPLAYTHVNRAQRLSASRMKGPREFIPMFLKSISGSCASMSMNPAGRSVTTCFLRSSFSANSRCYLVQASTDPRREGSLL